MMMEFLLSVFGWGGFVGGWFCLFITWLLDFLLVCFGYFVGGLVSFLSGRFIRRGLFIVCCHVGPPLWRFVCGFSVVFGPSVVFFQWVLRLICLDLLSLVWWLLVRVGFC